MNIISVQPITDRPIVDAIAANDFMLIGDASDNNVVKRVLVSSLKNYFAASSPTPTPTPTPIPTDSLIFPYIPTLLDGIPLVHGTSILDINNNQIVEGLTTNGLLSDASSIRILVSFALPIKLSKIDFYGVQGDLPEGIPTNSSYRVDTINIYSRNIDIPDNLIGTFAPNTINGLKQTFNLTANNSISDVYIFEFKNNYIENIPFNGIGILELDLFGVALAGGEVS